MFCLAYGTATPKVKVETILLPLRLDPGRAKSNSVANQNMGRLFFPGLCAKLLIHTGGYEDASWIIAESQLSVATENLSDTSLPVLSPCPLRLSLKSGDYANPMLRGGVPRRVLGETGPDCLGGFCLTRCVARRESVGLFGQVWSGLVWMAPNFNLILMLRFSHLSQPNLPKDQACGQTDPELQFHFCVFCVLFIRSLQDV